MNRRAFMVATSATVAGHALGGVPVDEPLVSFGVVTDVQYADAVAVGERHYRDSVVKLRVAAADLAKQKLPFTVHLGDVIDRDYASYAVVLPWFGAFGHPVKHLLGNHDYQIDDDQKSGLRKLLGMPNDYYAFIQSGVMFVVLDTNDVSLYKHADGSGEQRAAKKVLDQLTVAKSANAQPWNGGVSEVQLKWLDDQLIAAKGVKMPVVVCSHHPILPADSHQVWNGAKLLEVICRHDRVVACLSGHNHAGAEVVVNGHPFITFKSMLHRPDVTAYAVVRIYKNRMVIEGRGRESSRTVMFG